VTKRLLTELIGLHTLEQWVDTNSFNINAAAKKEELKKIFMMYDQVIGIANSKSHLTFDDITPVYGQSQRMQQEYLQKYEPKFPIHSVNFKFQG